MRLGDFVYGQRSKEKAAGKKLGTAALAVFVVLMLSLASGTMSYGMLQLMHPLGLGAFVPAMFYMAASVLTLITAVGYSRALLFASRDLDTLLSMPVSHLTLLLSKLAGLYVYELIFLAVLFVPAYITYFIVAGFTVSGLFTLLVGVLFGPLIPLALGLLVAFLFGLVMRRMKRRNIIQIVFFLVFFAAYMYLMSNSDAIFDFIGNAGSDFWNALTNAYFPAALLYNAVSGDLLSLLGFAVLNALPMLLVIALLSKCFLKMTALLKQSHKSAKFTMKHQKSSGLFGALLKKEFQRFTGSATYMLNCGLGVVLLLGLTVACFFIGDDILAEITASITELPIFCYAVTMMLFTSTLATTTSVSVTLEGRAHWVLKTAPVPTTTILAAKTAVNLILYLPTLLIAAILLSIRFSLGVQYALFLFLIPAAALVITTALGLILNLCFPKLDYDNETRAIKQSMSVFLSTMINMLLTILFSVPLYVLLVPYSQFFVLLACAYVLVLAAVGALLCYVLRSWGVKKFDSLQA